MYSVGNMDENGQWNGMVKELVEKVVPIHAHCIKYYQSFVFTAINSYTD